VPGAGILKPHQLSLSCILQRALISSYRKHGNRVREWCKGSRRRVVSVGDYFGVFGPPEPLEARLGFRLLSKNRGREPEGLYIEVLKFSRKRRWSHFGLGLLSIRFQYWLFADLLSEYSFLVKCFSL
jgi:hypothetical protein